jgi:serine/threonine protein kinase
MILNDFDVSRPLPWNRRTNEYCLIKDLGGPIAPELPDNLPSDESLDVWHVGTVLYTILTGLMPYYDELEAISSIDERNEQLKELVLSHRPPHFDKTLFGRTIIESRMLDIIERCLEFDPSKRPSIFDVLEFLKATKQEIVKLERKRSSEKHVRVRQRV